MHEVAIVNDLFRIILEVAEEEKISRVDKVHFQVGKMIQVVPELFRFAFDAAKEDTIASGADLEIEFLPVRMQCRDCGHTFDLEDPSFNCPQCRGVDLKLLQGKELLIKSIEGE